LYLRHLYLDLFEVGDFFIEEVEIGNELSASLEQDVLPLHFFLSLGLLHFGLVLLQELAEAFFGVLLPEVAVFLEIFLDVFSVFDDQVEVVGYSGLRVFD